MSINAVLSMKNLITGTPLWDGVTGCFQQDTIFHINT